MSCRCHCHATEAQFGPKVARRDLARYRRRGPDTTTRLLLASIRATGIRNARLLDIGAGIGVLHHELFGPIVSEAVHVEAAPAYITVAQEEDERRRQTDRVKYLLGDAVGLGGDLPSADLVTLDRVICCYPDWEQLLRASAAKAERVFAMSLPHDRWHVRAVVAAENLGRRLRGNLFRTFVHPIAAIDRVLGQLGFRRSYAGGTVAWYVALYNRGAAA
jgi:magnesium-protoporphyrin O-methyltransferase